jgi:hypothetical protein
MMPRTERQFLAAALAAFTALFLCGMLLAYGAMAAGVVGALSNWHVAVATFVGAVISFIGMVGYFAAGNANIRSSRLNDLHNS